MSKVLTIAEIIARNAKTLALAEERIKAKADKAAAPKNDKTAAIPTTTISLSFDGASKETLESFLAAHPVYVGNHNKLAATLLQTTISQWDTDGKFPKLIFPAFHAMGEFKKHGEVKKSTETPEALASRLSDKELADVGSSLGITLDRVQLEKLAAMLLGKK
jgi:hypothetical protein